MMGLKKTIAAALSAAMLASAVRSAALESRRLLPIWKSRAYISWKKISEAGRVRLT